MARQDAPAVAVRLGTGAAQLDGFKSRQLQGTVTDRVERRWHYVIEWHHSILTDSTASSNESFKLLILGTMPPAVSLRRHTTLQSISVDEAFNIAEWHAIAFTSSLRCEASACMTELRVVDIAIRLLQAEAELDRGAPTVWLCTMEIQPVWSTRAHTYAAGLYGLARTCRQEYRTLPVWCIDVSNGAQSIGEMIQRHRFRLPSGSVRGLQLGASIEPEVACCASSLCVPRLVAPYNAQPMLLELRYEALCRLLDEHTSNAMAALDVERLLTAYVLLDTLCQQFVRSAVHALSESMVPTWHHKLLYSWCAGQLPPQTDSTVTPADVLSAHPRLWAEVQLAEHCGTRLADALSGAATFQELLFPGGSFETVLPVYEHAVVGTFYNECVVAVVKSILAQLRGSRIVTLEVGAGTGGTASNVLTVLDGTCERYVFTDVSDVFLRQARKRFTAFPFVEYEMLNIDADPRIQGFALHQCDIIIATNVLHATPFIRNALHNCEQLLCAGGMLVVNDALATAAFAQITFGLTDGWWLFHEAGDPQRWNQISPLLSWRAWQALLFDSGFCHVHCMQGGAFLQTQAVIVARTVASPKMDMCVPSQVGGPHFLSGGLGGLGLLTARLLVDGGAKRLVLSSRSDHVVTGSESDWAWLAGCHADVWRVKCDVSDHGSVRAAMWAIFCDGLSLGGVFHAAHQLADNALAKHTARNFRATYGPKVQSLSLSPSHPLTLSLPLSLPHAQPVATSPL